MKKKPLFLAMGLSLALVARGPGFWNVSESEERTTSKEGKGARAGVVEEVGPAGHQTIGIDENAIKEGFGKELLLHFSTLMGWDYRLESSPPPPEKIKALHGRSIRVTGFMFPLQEGKSIQYFCLMRTTQTCCYGPRPQFNQYIFVEMARPTDFHRLDPVTCVGTFKVEPTPKEGFIYRLEGKSCQPVIQKPQ